MFPQLDGTSLILRQVAPLPDWHHVDTERHAIRIHPPQWKETRTQVRPSESRSQRESSWMHKLLFRLVGVVSLHQDSRSSIVYVCHIHFRKTFKSERTYLTKRKNSLVKHHIRFIVLLLQWGAADDEIYCVIVVFNVPSRSTNTPVREFFTPLPWSALIRVNALGGSDACCKAMHQL